MSEPLMLGGRMSDVAWLAVLLIGVGVSALVDGPRGWVLWGAGMCIVVFMIGRNSRRYFP